MFSLFEIPPRNRGNTSEPGWSYIKTTINKDLDRIIRFRKDSKDDTYLGNHLLEDLLINLNLPPTETYEAYVDNALDKNPSVSRALGLTHATGQGRVHYGRFYNNLSTEIVISHEERFDVPYAITNWRELTPVKVVEHPYSDYSFLTPNGYYGVSKEALVVITVNTPMLALQHKRWLETEAINTDGSIKPIRMFLAKFVLTGMLSSHMDLVLWNRFMNTCKGVTQDINSQRPELPLSDLTRRIETNNFNLANTLIRAKYPINEIPQYFPLVTANNLSDYLTFTGISRTRYTDWAIGIARLNKLLFLIDFYDQYSKGSKSNWFSSLLRDFLKLSSDNVFKQYLPKSIYRNVMGKMKLLVDRAKGR